LTFQNRENQGKIRQEGEERLQVLYSTQKRTAWIAAVTGTAALYLGACTKPQPTTSSEQDTLVQSMTPHNFAEQGYAALQGGWSGLDFNNRIFADSNYSQENFISFNVLQKEVQMYALEGEARTGYLSQPVAENAAKAEANLSELIRTEPNANSPSAIVSFLRLGTLIKDFNVGAPKPVTTPFTIVTNRDELPYSPKPTTGPEWNQFIQDYCGGFQNPQLGFLWVEGNRKMCLKLWTGSNRQVLRLRTLVTMPRSHTSSALDARVSPWIAVTRNYAAPTPVPSSSEPQVEAAPPSEESTSPQQKIK
jgi:hypothetical protein